MTTRRKNNLILLAMTAMLFTCVAALPVPVSAAEESKADQIVKQNMFRRDRGRTAAARPNGTPAATPPATTTTAPPEPTVAPAPADPLASWVLRGMAIADGKPAAWIEDQQNMTVTRLALGDHVAGWSLHSATLDAIELRKDADTRKITVGQTLTGEAPAAAATTVGPGGAVPGESLLERLRRRRLESLGQTAPPEVSPAAPADGSPQATPTTPSATPPANPAVAPNPATTPGLPPGPPPGPPQPDADVIAAPTLIIPNTGEEP